MPSQTRIVLFDVARARQHLVPAWLRFVTTREVDGPLLEAARRAATGAGCACGEAPCVCAENSVAEWLSFPTGTDLAAHCSHLEPETLAYRGEARWSAEQTWEEHRCPVEACPARATCPLAGDEDRAYGASQAFLIGTMDCFEDGAIIGADLDGESLAHALRLADDHPARPLLDALGRRGFGVGYAFAEQDGVHGWLDAEETIRLRALLRSGADVLEIEPELAHLSLHLQASQAVLMERILEERGEDLPPAAKEEIRMRRAALLEGLAPIAAAGTDLVAKVREVHPHAVAGAMVVAMAGIAEQRGRGLALTADVERWW